jgi:phosphatidate cytidylyltransferase
MGALRELSVPQQVGLLFVLLFGGLALATAVAVLRSLRESGPRDAARGRAARRELRALWAGAALFWGAWVSGPLGATLLFGLVSFLALREFVTLMHTRRGDHRSLLLAFFAVLPLQYALVAGRHFDLFTVFIPVYIFLAIPVLSALAGDPERFLERNAKIQWGIMVCVYGLSHTPAVLLLQFPRYEGRGAFLLLFLVVVVASAHFAQQALARRLPRRPVARRIDRRFGLRAWGLGTLAAGAVGGLLYWITPFQPGPAIALALLASASGTLGELVMQALKRDAGVRAWGNRASVTGAVGLLDRVAALCFAAPVFFHSLRWYFHAGV